jgi:uroporphyrinogen-III synthase
VAIARQASLDPRFQLFNDLPEDSYDAFLSVPLLCRGKVVGVINVQHRKEHQHSRREIQLIGTIGFLVGAEIELARLESLNSELSHQLETRKLVERAKGILQREFSISEEEAYLRLRKQSRRLRKPMKDLAETIVLNEELKREVN